MDDSIFRAATLRKCGPVHRTRNVIYPVVDWTRLQLHEALVRTGTKLGPDYRILGRSFSGDGLDYKFIRPLMDHYPDDWQRLLRWYRGCGVRSSRLDDGG